MEKYIPYKERLASAEKFQLDCWFSIDSRIKNMLKFKFTTLGEARGHAFGNMVSSIGDGILLPIELATVLCPTYLRAVFMEKKRTVSRVQENLS